jgi:ubiquinone/menaquinone biosynthesis C-methylase UbiE
MTPDWQLPPGTDRGVWDYTHNPLLAQNYDQTLAGTALLELDLKYCDKAFATPGRLIDLGCGTGRLCLHLAARGFACTALDLSVPMLEEVQKKAKAAGLAITTVQANLAELEAIPAGHDYAGCLFSTYGMIRGKLNRLRFLKELRRLLKPGGTFVLHAHNRAYHRFRLVGLPWVVRDAVKLTRGREPGEYPMTQSNGAAKLTLRHFTRKELTAELFEAGFQLVDFTPISLASNGQFRLNFFNESRAYGFLTTWQNPA